MRKPAKQARSIKTRRTLLTALETLLKEKGFDQITVSEIAATAGVSTGLLYAHFTNKADFLEALLEAYKARIITRLEVVEAEDLRTEYKEVGSLRKALQLIAEHAYNQLLEDAHLIGALSQHLRARPDAEQAEWQSIRTRAAVTITPVLEVYADQISRPDKKLTAKSLVYFFNSIFSETLRVHNLGNSGMEDLTPEVFTQEIADFAYGYLTMTQE